MKRMKSKKDNIDFTIQDTKAKDGVVPDPRKINFGDIMVITYSKKMLKFYMNALRCADIPFIIEGNVLFDDCPALTAL